MPTIGAAVTADTKHKFEVVARQRSITTSRLAASLIVQFLVETSERCQSSGPGTIQLPTDRSTARGRSKTEQVFVRLEPYYFAELGRLADERNWYRSTYLANLFQAHADQCPVLCDIEINAVRTAARQLADIGRNLNQIAKNMNGSPEHMHHTKSVDFELVRMLVELELDAIKDLVKANQRRWGTNHGEA